MRATGGEGGEGVAGPINVKKFLADNKLSDVEQTFIERDIAIDELMDFEEEELVDFARDLGLDTLARKRFVKAIMGLKTKPATVGGGGSTTLGGGMTTMGGSMIGGGGGTARGVVSGESGGAMSASSSMFGSSGVISHVMVTPEEEKAVAKLRTLVEKCDLTLKECSTAERRLEVSARETRMEIDQKFDFLIKVAEDTRRKMLGDIDLIRIDKESLLKKQAADGSGFMSDLALVKHEMDDEIVMSSAKGELDYRRMKERSRNSAKRLARVLDAEPRLKFATEANMALHLNLDTFNTMLSNIEIDDCDQPDSPVLKLVKAGFSSVIISWIAANEDDMKRVSRFSIEVARIKSVKKKQSSKKKKKSKKKRKKYDSSSDDSSSDDSDSSSSDDSDSDDSGRKKKKKGDLISSSVMLSEEITEADMMALRWQEVKELNADEPRYWMDEENGISMKDGWTFEVRKLKDAFMYGIRIRAKNRSGWGLYSLPMKVITKPVLIDSKILKKNEGASLRKMLPDKIRKRRLKLLYRGSRDGYATANFHGKCDSKGATVTIIRSAMNHVFGGYTPLSWMSSGGQYLQDPKMQTFIFLLRTSQKHMKKKVPMKYSMKNSGVNAIYTCSSYGPTFGGGFDFYVAPNANTTTSSYCNAGNSFNCPSDQTLLAGSYNFMVKEIEVFQLKK